MKALKIVLAVLGGIIVLVIVAAVIFIKTFDPNSLKDDLTALVQERTGRTLAIDDSIELSLFPWFAVETGGVSLSDNPDFGDRNLIAIDELSARIRVWPLLKRRIEIGRIVFDGVNLNLGMDAEGRGNWASLLEYGQADDAPAPAAGDATPGRRSFEQLAVEGIEFRNARILWHDANGEVTYLVRDLNLETGAIRNDEPVELTLALSALDVATQASVEIELTTVARVVPEPRPISKPASACWIRAKTSGSVPRSNWTRWKSVRRPCAHRRSASAHLSPAHLSGRKHCRRM
jgi:AsmA protein